MPQGKAIGKLSVVIAEGRDPRLVLDRVVCICNANKLCRIPERVALPSAMDVRRAFLSTDMQGSWRALSLDVKAARKCFKVAPAERGSFSL